MRFWEVDFDFDIQLKRLTRTLNFTESDILKRERGEKGGEVVVVRLEEGGERNHHGSILGGACRGRY